MSRSSRPSSLSSSSRRIRRRKKQQGLIFGLAAVAVVGILFAGLANGIPSRAAPAASEKVQAYYEENKTLPTSTDASANAVPKAKSEVSRNGGQPLQVLFAGDSLTGGLSARMETEGFKWLMLGALEQSGPVTEHNSNLSGGTTLQVSGNYDVPKNLDLAVIELGTNDRNNSVPMAEFKEAYVSLLDRVVDGSPGVSLVCAGVWEAGGGSPEVTEQDVIIKTECGSRGGTFVSLRPIYFQEEVHIGPAGIPAFGGVADDYHPNSAGHQAIATALLGAFEVKK